VFIHKYHILIGVLLGRPQLSLADKLDRYLAMWSRLAAQRVSFDPAVCVSERSTADRNCTLAYMMAEMGAFESTGDLMSVLEFYFQTCSVTLTASMLANAAATLANGGTNPLTNDTVFAPETTRSCLSLMLSCGMYDYSGEWAFEVGLPSKSGVSGAIMVVVPNVMGICIWSPKLDDIGNSVRGQEFVKELVARYALHQYDSLRGVEQKRNPFKRTQQSEDADLLSFLFAAKIGAVGEMARLQAEGLNCDVADYDGRTAMHVAAAEGNIEVIRYLLGAGAKRSPLDRWGKTPATEARDGGFEDLAQLLEGTAGLPEGSTAV